MQKFFLAVTPFLLLSFQNCSQFSFTGSDASPAVQAPQDLGPLICDPFGGGNSGDARSGLFGRIRYISPTNSNDWLRSQRLWDYYDPAKSFDLGYSLIMRMINVEPRKFNTGFPIGDGKYVVDADGNIIKEWFSIRLDGKIKLRSDEREGPYRLAVESDDGSVVQIRRPMDTDYNTYIDNNNLQLPTLKSASVNLDMKRDSLIDIRVFYFQGPADDIAFRLFWRRDDDNDSLRVLMPENFVLPDGISNPCQQN